MILQGYLFYFPSPYILILNIYSIMDAKIQGDHAFPKILDKI
jgi:hypothetical protein